MKVSSTLATLGVLSCATSLSLPRDSSAAAGQGQSKQRRALSDLVDAASLAAPRQQAVSVLAPRDVPADPIAYLRGFLLEKRRGGGGAGGGGGRSSGGSSSSGSSSSGGSSSGGGGSSSGGGSRSSGSTSSGAGAGAAAGGATSVGRGYGGGRYYGGGASNAYRAGARSPLGIAPFLLLGGVAGAALLFPGLWLYGAYEYNYDHPYSFHNASNSSATGNTTLPVTCLCQEYNPCGCDDSGNSTTLDALIGDGDYANLNKSVINIANVNGTRTIVLNGTLPNGTDDGGSTSAAGLPGRFSREVLLVRPVAWAGVLAVVVGMVL